MLDAQIKFLKEINVLNKKQLDYLKKLSNQLNNSNSEAERAYHYFVLMVFIDRLLSFKKYNSNYFAKQELSIIYKNAVFSLASFYKCEINKIPELIRLDFGKWMNRSYEYSDLIHNIHKVLPSDLKNFKTKVKNGLIYELDENAKWKQANMIDNDDNIFVMSPMGDFHIFSNSRKTKYTHDKHFHHSSFLNGSDVLCAGEVVIKNGKIEKISTESGHYLPGPRSLITALLILEGRGIDISDIEVSFRSQENKVIKGKALLILNNYKELQTCDSSIIDFNKKAYISQNFNLAVANNQDNLIEQYNNLEKEFESRWLDDQVEVDLDFKDEKSRIDYTIKQNIKKTEYFTQQFSNYVLKNLEFIYKQANCESSLNRFAIFVAHLLEQKTINRNKLTDAIYDKHPEFVNKYIVGYQPFTGKIAYDGSKASSEATLIALQTYIVNKDWRSRFSFNVFKLGFKNIKTSINGTRRNVRVPKNVSLLYRMIEEALKLEDKDTALNDVMKFAAKCSSLKSLARSNDTQNFYDLFKNNNIVSKLYESKLLDNNAYKYKISANMMRSSTNETVKDFGLKFNRDAVRAGLPQLLADFLRGVNVFGLECTDKNISLEDFLILIKNKLPEDKADHILQLIDENYSQGPMLFTFSSITKDSILKREGLKITQPGIEGTKQSLELSGDDLIFTVELNNIPIKNRDTEKVVHLLKDDHNPVISSKFTLDIRPNAKDTKFIFSELKTSSDYVYNSFLGIPVEMNMLQNISTIRHGM